jgi:hypothetical protein
MDRQKQLNCIMGFGIAEACTYNILLCTVTHGSQAKPFLLHQLYKRDSGANGFLRISSSL